MKRGVPFEIVLDGGVRGLPDHRLSLVTFAKSLELLSKALLRTANQIVKEAAGSRGPVTAEARLVDFEVETLHRNCVRIAGEITADVPPGNNFPLFDALAGRTALSFLNHVANEVKGVPSSKEVRKYLQSLPSGLVAHKYRATVDGVEHEVEAANARIVHPTLMPGGLLTGVGEVSGVHFAPDPDAVVILLKGGHIRAYAPADLVARALELRGCLVRVMILVDRRESRPSYRLLWIRVADAHPEAIAPERRTEMILARWPETLRELAQ